MLHGSEPLDSGVRDACLDGGRPPLLRRGEILGEDLEVRALIGEGGMAQVYEAHDRALNRRVAIKVAWPEAGAGLRGEAQALAALHHESVPAIYAMSRHNGLEYLVMEHICGTSLEAYVELRCARNEPLGLHEIVETLVGIAEGLAVVHRAGIAHRDVKPANVILAPGKRVVLTDFGIFETERNPGTGPCVAGSPHYMAPETIARTVAKGQAFLVDVYALGVVAFELLTGRLPFTHDTLQGLLWMHLTDPPPNPLELQHGIPPELAAIVVEMLAKDPGARPESMDAIAWRLTRIDTGRRSIIPSTPLPRLASA